jgi:putative transposase
VTRYVWVAARKAEGFPTTSCCEVAKVSTSAFYAWVEHDAADPTERQRADGALVRVMREIHAETDGTYGSPRMVDELADRGHRVNHKRVERLMRVNGIVGVHKPAKVRTTLPAELYPPLPDLIERRFAPGAPNEAYVGDITYIATGEGWLYLASVLDLGSRRWVGYAMADHMRTELVADALSMAVGTRGGEVDNAIFHSDRGSQYMSGDYQDLVRARGMRQSVGRTGVCWDNSVAEAAWSSLKRELVHRYRFDTRAQARRAIFAWINRYNQTRRHSSLGNISPIAWETNYRQPKADKAA